MRIISYQLWWCCESEGHVPRKADGSAVDSKSAVEAPTLFEAAEFGLWNPFWPSLAMSQAARNYGLATCLGRICNEVQTLTIFGLSTVETCQTCCHMLKDGSKLFKNVQETLYVLSPTCISSVWSIDRWMVSTRPEVTDALPSAFDGFNWPILTVWQLGFLFVNNIHEWEQITSIRSLECPRAIRGPDTRLWRIVTYKADAFWFDGCSCKRNTFIIFYNSDNRLDGS